MEKIEKTQFISEDLARNPDEIEDIKQDVENWSEDEVDDYIYENFQHDNNEYSEDYEEE